MCTGEIATICGHSIEYYPIMEQWRTFVYIGWIQTLFRETVKIQNLGNLTLNSESASKIIPTGEI